MIDPRCGRKDMHRCDDGRRIEGSRRTSIYQFGKYMARGTKGRKLLKCKNFRPFFVFYDFLCRRPARRVFPDRAHAPAAFNRTCV